MVDGTARILLVDDEQSIQTLLAYPLRKEGYDVVSAHDGRDALDRFAEQRFDLVVLDVMMPNYITKPFSVREFRSRVKAALRRTQMLVSPAEETIVAGDIEIDLARRKVRAHGEEPSLTYVEFEILVTLARSPGHVFDRETMLERVWGDSAYRDQRTIDVHIRHLREKIERDARNPEYLLTVRGVGYRFRDGDG
jgi:DNA-binding response OmpR family regulator